MRFARLASITAVTLILVMLSSAALSESVDESHPPLPLPTREDPTVARVVGDILFARPVGAVRLVVGIGMLPLTVPVAAILGDTGWAFEVCLFEPAGWLFTRPLGRL